MDAAEGGRNLPEVLRAEPCSNRKACQPTGAHVTTALLQLFGYLIAIAVGAVLGFAVFVAMVYAAILMGLFG
jgi:hypothetical protein